MTARIFYLPTHRPMVERDYAEPIRFAKSDNIGRVFEINELPAVGRGQVSTPPVPIIDALADFIADVAERPSLAFVCAFGGVLTGMFATVGLAYVWSLFL